MKSPSTEARILWAIDPFTTEIALHNKAAQAIAAWRGKRRVVVEPVTVLSPDQATLSAGLFLRVCSDIRGVAEKRIGALAARTGVTGLLAPTVLVSNDFSRRSSTQTLVDYAKQVQAELIVATSRARKGIKRAAMGSFAETLVLRSDVPLLVVTPNARETAAFERILFATDLSTSSRKAFDRVVAVAKERKAKLVVYHKLEMNVNDWTPMVSGVAIPTQWIRTDIARQRHALNALVQLARRSGVKATGVWDTTGGAVADGISGAAAKTGSELIALASESGPTATVLLGSVSRSVLRTARLPLWLVHPSRKEKK